MNQTNAKPVVFLHIPKTAGSTLYRILESHYRWENIYTVWQTGTLDELKQLPPAQLANIALLRGHFALGLRHFLPETAVYFTILREPIDRVVSYYHFIRRTPSHYCHDRVVQNNLSLLQFVTSQMDALVDNGQTRLLSNLNSGHDLPFGQSPAELLEQARENLQRMQVIGLTERFDETLLLLRHAFGWQKIHYSQQNVTAKRKTVEQLPAETVAAIAACNQLDIALYEEAKKLFEAQLTRLGEDVPAQLAAFRQTNGRLRPLTHFWWELRKYPVRTYLRKLLSK